MDHIELYGHAIVAIVVYALITFVLNALTGMRKDSRGMAPGAFFDADYSNPDHRLDRAYMNSMELMAPYVTIVICAILVGANPLITNILASLGLLCRIVVTFTMIRGIGKGYGGIRTGFAILLSLCCFAMAVMVFKRVFFG